MAVCRKWEVLATVIGEVTDGDRLRSPGTARPSSTCRPRTVAHEGPVYERPVQRPDTQDALNADTSDKLPRPTTGDELRATLLALLGSPHLCSRAFITEQYDRYVRGNTVLAENADGGVLRVDESTGRGIAVSTDASGRYTQLDPYAGCAAGAGRGVPQRRGHRRHPDRGDQLPELRLAGGSRRHVAVLRSGPRAGRWLCGPWHSGHRRQCQLLQPDRDRRRSCPPRWSVCSVSSTTSAGASRPAWAPNPARRLLLLGDTRDEFDGSIWAQVTADHLGGLPPEVDLAREQLLAEVLAAASRDGLISAAHDLSEGGLMQAVVEAALAGETGCRIILPEVTRTRLWRLFSESAGRVLVAVPRTEESRFRSMCEARGLPATRIGVVDQGSDAVEVQDQFTVTLEDLRSTSEGVLPGLFG